MPLRFFSLGYFRFGRGPYGVYLLLRCWSKSSSESSLQQ